MTVTIRPLGRPGDLGWVVQAHGELYARDERVGCVFCVTEDDTTARLRILLVDPRARGQRLGARLVDTCVAFARDAGYTRMVLWTNHPLAAARSIYLAAGFALVAEEPHHSYGVDLVGQTYTVELS